MIDSQPALNSAVVGDALVVVDVQRDVVAGCLDRDEVIGRIRHLIARARAIGTPVVFVQHEDDDLAPGTPGWELVPEVDHRPDDTVVAKRYRDAFAETTLSEVLARLKARRLFVAGAASDYCVYTTVVSAAARGYDVVLVEDCHTTHDSRDGNVSARSVIAFVNARVRTLRYPRVAVAVRPASDLRVRSERRPGA